MAVNSTEPGLECLDFYFSALSRSLISKGQTSEGCKVHERYYTPSSVFLYRGNLTRMNTEEEDFFKAVY